MENSKSKSSVIDVERVVRSIVSIVDGLTDPPNRMILFEVAQLICLYLAICRLNVVQVPSSNISHVFLMVSSSPPPHTA